MNIKTLITTLLLLSLSIAGYGQEDDGTPFETVYLSKQKTVVNSEEESAYKRVIYHVRDKYVFVLKDYYPNGVLASTGSYHTRNYKDLRSLYCTLYRHGDFKYYNQDGILIAEAKYEHGKEMEYVIVNENVQDISPSIWNPLAYAEQMPEAPYDVFELMGKVTYYPSEAKMIGASGRVNVKFVVDEIGDITNIEVSGDYKHISMAKSALNTVSHFTRWIPGKQDGKPVNVRYSVPVTFKLE